MAKVFVFGWDCVGPEILAPASLAELPHLRRLWENGISGPLRSVLPPITVPAWTSMLTGRDPGELGIYGFRNRRSFSYGDLAYATSAAVRFPRIWDFASEAGLLSVVVGVPQTFPPPPIAGVLVSGFDSPSGAGVVFTHPPELGEELVRQAGEYLFDVEDFRHTPRQQVLERVHAMTERRCELMERLLRESAWDFGMLCEIGPDRLHHCFWSDHDPEHPRHDPASPFRGAIRAYYRRLDHWLGRFVELAGPGSTVLVASDHGAQPMRGGVCINEVLRRNGWLTLRSEPSAPSPLRPEQVDWSRTRAWGEGGYYARIFLNVEGREPCGIVPFERRDEAREELTRMFQRLELPGGPVLTNRVIWPEQAYRKVRGLAPDLLVLFAELSWRSLGTVGHDRTWLVGNDTGLDEANHSQDGVYVLAAPRPLHDPGRTASILDITPTLLARLGLPVPEDLAGENLLAEPGATSAAREQPGRP